MALANARLLPRNVPMWSPGSHIGTFRGNNLAFASANAYLDVLERDDILANVRDQGTYLLTELERIQQTTPLIVEVRGLGLMLGLEMAHYGPVPGTGVAGRFQRAALRRGLVVEIGGRDDSVVRLLPPLNVSRQTVDEALAIIRDSIAELNHDLARDEPAEELAGTVGR